jgi:hypothetical protein
VNYFDHNDRKNADARIRAQIHNAERAKSRDFDGTLLMSKYDTLARCREAHAIACGLDRMDAPTARVVMHVFEHYRTRTNPHAVREPRCEFSANRAMAGGR